MEGVHAVSELLDGAYVCLGQYRLELEQLFLLLINVGQNNLIKVNVFTKLQLSSPLLL